MIEKEIKMLFDDYKYNEQLNKIDKKILVKMYEDVFYENLNNQKKINKLYELVEKLKSENESLKLSLLTIKQL